MRKALLVLVLFSFEGLSACGKKSVPSDAALLDAAPAPSASAAGVSPLPDSSADGGFLPNGRFLAGWRLAYPADSPTTASLVAADAAHTRAIVRIDPPTQRSEGALEIVTVDWTTHETQRFVLKNLGGGLRTTSLHDGTRSETVDFASADTAAEIAAYGRALHLGGPPFADEHVAVSPDGTTVILRFGDALYRAGANGNHAERFGARDGVDPVVSPRGDVVAYGGCEADCGTPQNWTLRLAGLATPNRERRIEAAVHPSRASFSADGSFLYVATWRDPGKAPCLLSVRVSSGETKTLACASIAYAPLVVLAPGNELAALLASGGPTMIGYPEITTISLPDGATRSTHRLDGFDVSESMLTDDGTFVGGSIGNWGAVSGLMTFPVLDQGDAGAHGTRLSWSSDTQVHGTALAGPRSVVVLVARRTARDTFAELYAIDLPPRGSPR